MPIPGLSIKTQSPKNWNRSTGKLTPPSRSSGPKKYGKYKPKRLKLGSSLTKLILGVIVAGLIIGSVSSLGVLIWVSRNLPDPNKIIERDIALSTKIYDRTGEDILYDIHGEEKRTMIELSDIPQFMLDATLTAEDRKFYEHKGYSITGVIRSVIKNITTGSRVGGSTLTQQLVKNAILSPEKTYTRKIKELILSYQIERKFSKEEILKLYFNEIPYGSTAYGIEAGAQTYFGKSVDDLTLGEAAILAAMPQAPSYYSPYGTHVEELYGRQGWVLDSMVELNYITEDQATAAKNETIEFKKKRESIVAPHFVMYVKEYLSEKYGERAVEQGGLKVITTLDLYKQEIAEEAVTNGMKNIENRGGSNAALVALDPKNGQILAMVGSKDFYDEEIDGQVNVTIRDRQPGSSFKPIVYAAAFQKGYTPNTTLFDVETTFLTEIGKDYTPKNYDLKEHGPVTIRKALAGSLNIPAVKTIYLTGVDNVLDLADKLGYTTLKDRSRFGLSLVLGGGEVKLIEHVNAYSVFAREGEWHPITSILRVEDKEGKVLEEWEETQKKVMETQIARQINNILSDNAARAYAFGENSALQLGGRPVAAKTGTTNDYRDAWTIGYTPSLSVGVWAGNNDNSEMSSSGSMMTGPIWNEFMRRVLGDTPIESFKEPDEVKTNKPILDGQVAGQATYDIDRVSGLLATKNTPSDYIVKKTFTLAHNILYYVNKDDPQGLPPADPTQDWQYQNWEDAVAKWAQENNMVLDEPPTEYDNVHLPEYQPTIKINTPKNNDKIISRDINLDVQAAAPRGISKVEYYIDNSLIGVAQSPPFNIMGYIGDPAIGSGFYKLKAIAYDDVGNRSSEEINLNLILSDLPLTINVTSPSGGTNILKTNFPQDLSANLSATTNITSVTFYLENTAGGRVDTIGNIKQISSNTVASSWLTAPTIGEYKLYAKAFDNIGRTFVSPKIDVSIVDSVEE
ncbi:PBP1A family penicillin-binding protein [Patescibacteria group bacterium]|nr:PBP1A family penicillin-binding protein [Patescibacteria group bacterium]